MVDLKQRAEKIRLAMKVMAARWKAARAKVEPIGGGGAPYSIAMQDMYPDRSITAKDGAIGGGG